MNCQHQSDIASLISVGIITLNILSFYGWRRLPVPWRTVSFVVFALGAILAFDAFAYGIAYSLAGPPVPASATCR